MRGRSFKSFHDGCFQQLESEDGRDHSERGKYSVEDANHPPPLPSDGVSFESVLKDRDELEGFQKYLEKKDPKGLALNITKFFSKDVLNCKVDSST